jgi:hypothetical protein
VGQNDKGNVRHQGAILGCNQLPGRAVEEGRFHVAEEDEAVFGTPRLYEIPHRTLRVLGHWFCWGLHGGSAVLGRRVAARYLFARSIRVVTRLLVQDHFNAVVPTAYADPAETQHGLLDLIHHGAWHPELGSISILQQQAQRQNELQVREPPVPRHRE